MSLRSITTVGGASSAVTTARPFIVNELKLDSKAELDQLARSLLAPAASIPPKYFYDALGSTLYNAIVLTDEYYPTRTEAAIFDKFRAEIADTIGSGKQFVDLGSGDSVKAEKWFPSLAPSRYVAVDISESAVEQALARLAGSISTNGKPELCGLITDFSRVLNVKHVIRDEPTVFFYPGSSIGNFMPDEAAWFLKQIHAHRRTDGCGLLIGVDTKKDHARLDAAYDDALGVTAAFNLNTLRHVNELLKTNFNVSQWRHRGFYNAALGRIEMHVEATCDLSLQIRGETRRFKSGERIHTENSYKYSPIEFEALLRTAGFDHVQAWHDDACDFCVYYAY